MRCLILGANGQDGSYLADILTEQGHDVWGLVRRSSAQPDNLRRIAHLLDHPQFRLIEGDALDPVTLSSALSAALPDEIYHVADQDNVGYSRRNPGYQMRITLESVVNLLQLLTKQCSGARLFVPLSATMLSHAACPQGIDAPLDPQSPYAVAKTAAWQACKHWRRREGVRVSCGIMFNHSSPRQTGDYLLPTIVRQVLSGGGVVALTGSPQTRVDVGFAREYMEGAVAMLRHPEPDDWVIGAGATVDIETIVRAAARAAGESVTISAPHAPPGPARMAAVRRTTEKLGWFARTSCLTLVRMMVQEWRKR